MNNLTSRYLELRNDIKLRLATLFAENSNRTQTWSDHTSKWKPMEFELLNKPFKFFDHNSKDRVAVGTVKNGLFIMCQEGDQGVPFEVIHLNTVQQLSLIEHMES